MEATVIKKIVVIGPESTGKSTLCKQLAQHYNSSWCPEYAREYLLKNGTKYSYGDLLKIATGQIALEENFIQSAVSSQKTKPSELKQKTDNSRFTIHDSGQLTQNALLFIDTDMYVMKVWCEFVFGKSHKWINDQVAKRKYDLYLLCNVDLPWIKDELREYPDLETREKLYHIYKNILTHQSVPWISICGSYEERLKSAIEATNNLLKK